MQSMNTEYIKKETAIWQEYIPTVAWRTIFLAIGIALGYYLTITNALNGSLSYIATTLICGYLAFASFTVVHDAGHGSIIKTGSSLKSIEDILGWIYSIPLLIVSYRFFQKIHDRHHAFTNDPERDPDHFSLGTKWYQVLANTFLIPFQYHIMSVTSLRHIKIFRDTYVSTCIYTATTFGTLLFFTYHGFIIEVICFAIIPNIIATFLLVMFFDYIPHHPHKSQDRYHNTRIFPGKLWNILLLGQNYHLIHHLYPRVPWYKYEELYYNVLPDLEAHNAPIEHIGTGLQPGFMQSPNVRNLQDDGKSVNMLLKVKEIRPLTDNAVSVLFEQPNEERLQYKAGQYITISKWLDGEQQTRCYSLCSSPHKGELKIAVRQTTNGLMSQYINQALEIGDELIVQGPFGDFIYPPHYPAHHDNKIDALALIAAGSGITPLLAILEVALHQNNRLKIHLLYACHSEDNIMFLNHLQSLANTHPEQLKVSYIISETRQNLGLPRQLDRKTIETLLSMTGANANNVNKLTTEFYICGPESFKDFVVNTLSAHKIPLTRIHIEQFVTAKSKPIGIPYLVSIRLKNNQKQSLYVAANQTVLEVAKENDVQLPHACGNGTCGTCKFKVNQGRIKAIANSTPGITAEEQAAGFTLACQCKPLSNLTLSEIGS